MERFDIAVVGSGPAGLSAAITAKIRNKNTVVFGSADLSEKLLKAHSVQNYLGFPDITGSELADRFKAHIASLGIEIIHSKVSMVYAMGDYFSLEVQGRIYEAKTVILATGVYNEKEIPGEKEFLGRGVSYCATCDAPLYRGKNVAVIGYNDEALEEARFLSETAKTVFFLPIGKVRQEASEKISIISGKPLEIKGETQAEILVTEDGEISVDGVFILRDSISPSRLVPGLKTENNHIKTDINMTTNIPGLFVCGDAAGKPYQYIKSAGQGNTAALSAVGYLAVNK